MEPRARRCHPDRPAADRAQRAGSSPDARASLGPVAESVPEVDDPVVDED
jgi:hypothetical protein